MKFLILFVLSALLLAQAWSASIENNTQNRGPGDFIVIGDKTYLIGYNDMSISSALGDCRSVGMGLVNFEDADAWNSFYTHLLEIGSYFHGTFWTSGQNDYGEGWIWTSTQQEITYFDWAEGYPKDQSHDIVCLFFATSSNETYNGYKSESCTEYRRRAVCG